MRRLTTMVLLLLCLRSGSWAAENRAELRLTGLVDLPGLKQAVIETHETSACLACCTTRTYILGTDERDDHLKVLEIDLGARTVKITLDDTPVILKLVNSITLPTDTSAASLTLEAANIQSALDLYGDFSGRTILQSPRLPNTTFTVRGLPANRTEAAKLLERLFLEQNVMTIPDGDKFVMLVPKEEVAKIHPGSAAIKLPANSDQGSFMHFIDADLSQVMMFYSLLVGARDAEPGTRWPAGTPVFLHARGLAKEEAVYALDTLLLWQGFKPVRTDAGIIKLNRL